MTQRNERPAIFSSDKAIRVARELLTNPNIHIRAVAGTVRADALLTATVVGAAHGAQYGQRDVRSVEHAVNVLGLEKTRAVAMQVVFRQLVDAIKVPAAKAMGERVWRHSVTTACVAECLDQVAGDIQGAARSYMLALMHELPALVFLGYSRQRPEQYASAEQIAELFTHSVKATPKQLGDWLGLDPRLVSDGITLAGPTKSVWLAHHMVEEDNPIESANPEDVSSPMEIREEWSDALTEGQHRARLILVRDA